MTIALSRSVRPLMYLFVRSFVNGVKRSVGSPRRLISLLFFTAYWAWLLLRPVLMPDKASPVFEPGAPIALPGTDVIDAVVFGIFGALSILFLSSVLAYKGTFRPADVDVLFPTPADPKVVLVFRLFRDYVTTLLLPLLLAIFGGNSTYRSLKPLLAAYPREAALVGKASTIAWLMMSLAWVCVGYGMTLFVNRSDLQSDRNKKWIGWTITALIAFMGLYVAIALRRDFSTETAKRLCLDPVLRLLNLPAAAATEMVMGPLRGDLRLMYAGGFGLIALAAGGLAAAMSQVGFMYDQASAKGFGNIEMRQLQRSGDVFGVMAVQAREGKLKVGRVSRWLGAMRVRGGAALVWKELMLQLRGAVFQNVAFLIMTLFLSWMPIWASRRQLDSVGYLYLSMQAVCAFLLGFAASQVAFIEMLRRVDLQKPLPFTPSATVFWETVARIIPAIIGSSIACLGVLVLRASMWPFAVAGLFITPSLTLVITSVTLMVSVLFPDFDDPTQRGFRSLMQMLGVVLVLVPGIGIAIGMFMLKLNPLIVSIPVLVINGAITIALCTVAGRLYADFNPSE